MQAITIAIGKAGIEYFARTIVADKALDKLQKMTPPDRVIPVNGFNTQMGLQTKSVEDIKIALSDGRMGSDYRVEYRGVKQLIPGSEFELTFGAGQFSESYHWFETYEDAYSGTYGGKFHKRSASFPYSPVAEKMKVNPILTFVYGDVTSGCLILPETYAILVKQGQKMFDVTIKDRAIPKHSILQQQPDGCLFSSHVDDTVAQSIANVDFSKTLEDIFPSVFASIPASGQLSAGITYDFALGVDGLKFPEKGGITIGVTGAVRWNGEAFKSEAEPEPVLCVPDVPTASGDAAPFMYVYVSSYEINALYWAYFMAGKLERTVKPADLLDPGPLKTNTYAPTVAPLKRYGRSDMYATINPAVAPVVHCQQVYIFSDDAMRTLETELPPEVYGKVDDYFSDEAYDSKEVLEKDLSLRKVVVAADREMILEVTGQRGMVTKSTLNFKLVIHDESIYVDPRDPRPSDPDPEILFTVERTDILTGLRLGATGFCLTEASFDRLKASHDSVPVSALEPMKNQTYISQALFDENLAFCLGDIELFSRYQKIIIDSAEYPVQSMKFEFINVANEVKFESSTVPDLTGEALGEEVWPAACEPQYMKTMNEMGDLGVPIPIMSGFDFVFEKANLIIELNYVSIAAQVSYRNLKSRK